MRAILVALSLCAAPAHAALVSFDTYTRDSTTGLDWLDVNLTAGLSFADAASVYTGWRFASGDELDSLAQRYIGDAPLSQFCHDRSPE